MTTTDLTFHGLDIQEKLYEGKESIVFRAHDASLDASVIIKAPRDLYPSPRSITRLRHEYEICKSIKGSPSARILRLENQRRLPFLVIEDIQGVQLGTVANILKQDIGRFLDLTISICQCLRQLHECNIVHGGLEPENILVNPVTDLTRLIDFGSAIRLPTQRQEASLASLLDGNLNYRSPEQTGRINRLVDHRTDFYSLGATLYHVLTGQTPFQAEDALELLHSHIARLPAPPIEINDQIPVGINDIVVKLLSKSAEDRYRSCHGLIEDFRHCRLEWQKRRTVEPFPLARENTASRLVIPQKLYGREAEREQLLRCCRRIGSDPLQLLLVSGPAGIGKSVLIREAQEPILEQHGYFLSGKFDQLRRDVPYASLITAFRSLVQQLLCMDRTELSALRNKLTTALGGNGAVITEMLPELELIVAAQPPLEPLLPVEAQNRFTQTFLRFIGVFAEPEHPMVIFLDDLQWADSASMQLLKAILDSPEVRHLLVIGAFRDAEVSQEHPFRLMLDGLRHQDYRVAQMELQPLSLNNVTGFLVDTRLGRPQDCHALAEQLHRKTDGNPFFMNRLISSLVSKELIHFNGNGWDWDLERIRQAEIPGDVVDLVLGEMGRLTPDQRSCLLLAACIGNQFDLSTLSLISGVEPVNVAVHLDVAITESLILPTDGGHDIVKYLDAQEYAELGQPVAGYRFQHDRIQQAAYSALKDDRQRTMTHLRIGNLLLANQKSNPDQDSRLLELVTHLNEAVTLIHSPEERIQLAELNLQAAADVKASVAYTTALRFLDQGVALLPLDGWKQHYRLAYSLHKERLECQYLCKQFDAAQKSFQILVDHSGNLVDTAEIYGIKIILDTTLYDFASVLKLGREGLQQLGWTMPRTPRKVKWAIRREFLQIQMLLWKTSIESLIHQPVLQDRLQQARLNLMAQMIPVLYYTDMEMSTLFYLKMASASMQHGTMPLSSVAYLGLGRYFGEVHGNYKRRQAFGELALKLVDILNSKALKCKAHFLYGGFIQPWTRPAHESLAYLKSAHQAGVEAGDLIWACYANNVACMRLLFLARNVNETEAESQKYLTFALGVGEQYTPHFHFITRQTCRALQGKTKAATDLSDDDFDEASRFADLASRPELLGCLNWYYVCKTLLYFLADDFDTALRMAEAAHQSRESAAGLIRVTETCFHLSLCLAIKAGVEPDPARRGLLIQQLRGNGRQLREWGRNSPQNFRHKATLIEAELARLQNQPYEAEKLFQQAILQANESTLQNSIAIAHERAADFYQDRGFDVIARAYRLEARQAYLQWGALLKVSLMVKQYPWISRFQEPSMDTHAPSRSHLPPAGMATTSENLDFNSVIKATQALSSEILLEKLLARIVHILLENAGAQRVALILENRGQPCVEAEGRCDHNEVKILQAIPLAEAQNLPLQVINYVLTTSQHVLLNNASQDGAFIHDPCISAQQLKSLLCLPLISQGKLVGVVYLENNLSTDVFNPQRMETIAILSSQLAISLENAGLYSEQAAYNRAYGRFIPHEFLEFLDRDTILDVSLGDQVLKRMSVMFADIRNFSSLSEKLTPKESFDFLNRYLSHVGPVIRQHNGFIDKFIGDAVMALFPQGADDAVNAAISLQKAVEAYNFQEEMKGLQPIKIGIGIHTGDLMLGVVGENERMESTVISDVVNVADRVEGLTKIYGTPIAITSATFNDLTDPHQFQSRFLGPLSVRGTSSKIGIFDVYETDYPSQKQLKGATRELFNRAVNLYGAEQWFEAGNLFLAVLELNPHDRAAQHYYTRCSGHTAIRPRSAT
ncbi:AAA family ATPase [Synechococcus sp. RedBA-s]|uniref:AAA family ATPase n=1 Tax=Synechococcus sp. RedBA-s TaxID=2823741 RepID=UPI0020CCAF4E|nr:AAA family ATPase [Synechococcus sp. RedBA-s]MCP9800787.1 AAA family ATPase [Synechococcus sp. RedBA-s]